MNTIVRTPVHKRTPLHFLVDGLQVWVSYLDENQNGKPKVDALRALPR